MAKRVLFYLLFVLGVNSSAMAGEIRILDPHGLIRVTKEISGESTVVVQLASDITNVNVSLSNLNGLAADISGIKLDNRTISFASVPEGNWRIGAREGAITVLKVEIR